VRNKLETLLSATEANFVDMKEASDKLSKGSAHDALATDFDMQGTLTGLKSVL
jgi:hypothetical protein